MATQLKRILFWMRKVELNASISKIEENLRMRNVGFDIKEVGYCEYLFFANKSFATMRSQGIINFDSRIQTKGKLISTGDNVTGIEFSSSVRPEIIMCLIVWIIFITLWLSGIFAIEWWVPCLLLPIVYVIYAGFLYLQIDGLQDVVETSLKDAIKKE